MAKSATHQGTCQACGRIQKLPGGLLSKHGYQVADRGMGGWFEGTCSGSDNKPFEETCELTKDLIVRAEEQMENLYKSAAIEKEKCDPENVWVTHRFSRWGQSMNVRASLILVGEEIKYILKSDEDKEPRRFQYKRLGTDLVKAAASLNQEYARGLERQAKNFCIYVANQKERVAGWKKMPLMKVVK